MALVLLIQDLPLSQQQEQSQPANPNGFPGDGRSIPAGATAEILGGLAEELGSAGFEEGPAPDLKKMPQIEPAQESADNMKKLILDQLEENNAT